MTGYGSGKRPREVTWVSWQLAGREKIWLAGDSQLDDQMNGVFDGSCRMIGCKDIDQLVASSGELLNPGGRSNVRRLIN